VAAESKISRQKTAFVFNALQQGDKVVFTQPKLVA
jgi:hypothetical protein